MLPLALMGQKRDQPNYQPNKKPMLVKFGAGLSLTTEDRIMPNSLLSREQAFDAVSSELDYQASRWNVNTTSTGGNHTTAEFVLYMQNYLHEAATVLSRNGEPAASEAASHIIRKITALGVSCMMQNGAPKR